MTIGALVGYLSSSLVSTSLNFFQSVSWKFYFGVVVSFGVSSSRMLRMGTWSVQSHRCGSV